MNGRAKVPADEKNGTLHWSVACRLKFISARDGGGAFTFSVRRAPGRILEGAVRSFHHSIGGASVAERGES